MEKKLTFLFAFGALFCSLSAFADAPDPVNEKKSQSEALTFEHRSGVYARFTGSALAPNETGIGSFTDSWQYAQSDGGIVSRSKPSKADYEFSAAGLLGYDFYSRPDFVEAEFFYLSNSKHNYNDTSSHPVSFGSVFFNVGIPFQPNDVLVSDAYLKYKVYQTDARLGRRFHFFKNTLELSPSVGLRWADLTHDLSFLYGYVRSSYWGVGPTFAVDGVYTIYKGFKFVSHLDASLLIGHVDAYSKLDFFGISKYKSPNTNRIVPVIGARLALRYDFVFGNKSSLNLEAGYQAATYIGAFDILTGFREVPLVQVQRIASITSNNFSYSGPYASLAYHM